MDKLVSIIMVNYNGATYVGTEDLIDAVKSFLETNYLPFEFIFVDNNSSDDSLKIIEKILGKYKDIPTKIVKVPENLGFTGGCEEGLKYAKGEYIVLVNNDDKALNPNWLTELIKVLNSDNTIGAVFSKKLKWDNPRQIDARGLTINPAGLIQQTNLKDEISECLIWQTPVLIRRSVIEKIGGLFDKEYIILNDDADSSLRIWLAGYKILYVPSSMVLHKRSATIKNLPVEFVAFHGRKNTIQTLIKNYETKNVVRWLPFTLMVYLGSILYYLAIKRLDHVKANIKAIWWIFANLPKILEKRKKIQALRRIPDKEVFKLFASFDVRKIIRGRKVWPR